MVARRSAIATFTAIRNSQVPKALSPRNSGSFSQARTKVSWTISSASPGIPGKPEAEGVDAPHVLLVEQAECVRIPLPGALDGVGL